MGGERGWNERNPCVDPSAYSYEIATLTLRIKHIHLLHDLTDISLHFLWYPSHDPRSFATVWKMMRRFTISFLQSMGSVGL